MSRNQFVEALRAMKYTVFALISDDGRLLDASDGFVNLLPSKTDGYVSVNVSRFFLQPRFETVIKCTGSFSGNFTVGTYSSITTTLSGTFCREDEGWLFLAELDQNEITDINSRISSLNYLLSEKQRQLFIANLSLQKREKQAVEESLLDELTGLGNRRQLANSLEAEIARARRCHGNLSLIMCDLDHFKNINDNYGHDAGDFVLKLFSDVVSRSIRKYDVATRYGGEEFVILLHDEETVALALAERIRATLETENFHPYPIKVTASFGVAKLDSDDTPESLIKKADTAMYHAKQSGRNRVMK